MINIDYLLSTKAFIENEYLIKYVNLINANIDTEREAFKTQKHHIIPRCYYKINCLQVDNSKTNIVNLNLKDHLVAHYYLSLCANKAYKYALIYAFNYMYNKMSKDTNINIEQLDLSEYETLYKHFCENQSKKKIGNIPWNKGGNCYTEAQRLNMRNAHLGKKDSEETRKRKSLGITGKNAGGCYVNNGQISKHIKLADLDYYLSEGWCRGSIQNHSKMIGKKTLHKDNIEIKISSEYIAEYIANGWELGRSQKAKDKTSKANKGKIAWNKGKHWSESTRKKISLNHGNFKNKIFMTNSEHTIRIDISLQDEYIKLGYHRGMK